MTTVFPAKYKVISLVGQGGYGAVYKARVVPSNGPQTHLHDIPTPPPEEPEQLAEVAPDSQPAFIAVKVIEDFGRSIESLRCVWRELNILKHFQYLPQVVPLHSLSQLKDTALSPDGQLEERRSLYIEMDYIPHDLSHLRKRQAIRKEQIIRSIIAQILLCLRGMHAENCLHRDLSPKNILVDARTTTIYICDFGLARVSYPEEQMSYGVVTQWYRAPEVLTDCRYDSKIDIWSVGTIMGELFLQAPLFAGDNRDVVDQLNRVLYCLGIPSEWPPAYATASVNAKRYLNRLQEHNIRATGIDGFRFVVKPSAAALAFLKRLLDLDPEKRPTADEALRDPWFAEDPELKLYMDDCIGEQNQVVSTMAPILQEAWSGGRRSEADLLGEIEKMVSESELRDPLPDSGSPA